MGASQGKTNQEQKEEARLWADAKDIQILTLCEENTKLINEIHLLQADFQAMKRTIEQQQLIIEKMSKEKSPRRVRFEEDAKEEQRVCCCPTTQEEHDAELQYMFDKEWELVVSSHALVSAQKRYMPGEKLDWTMLDDKGQEAAILLQKYGYPESTIDDIRRVHDLKVKFNKELFKYEGNHFKSVAKALFDLRIRVDNASYQFF
jgi:hypothetical protein